MHRVIIAFLSLAALVYGWVGLHIYEQDRFIDPSESLPVDIPAFSHPESNLRFVRESFAAGNYSNDLKPFLEAAITQAPASYQSWYLMASFHSNRAEDPEQVRRSLEAAVERFPANGRLRLSIAQWLLSARSNLPYRTYRASPRSENEQQARQERALAHLSQAVALEPNLLRATITTLDASNVPMNAWPLPSNDRTSLEILLVLNRSKRHSVRLDYLRALLAKDGERELPLLHQMTSYALAWGDLEAAVQAAIRWQRAAAAEPAGGQTVTSTLSLVDAELRIGRRADAMSSLRRGLETLKSQGTERSLGVRLLSQAGTVYLNLSDPLTAESLYNEAVGLSPRNIEAKLNLANFYRVTRERFRAMEQLREVLKLSPGHSQAQESLDRLLSEQN